MIMVRGGTSPEIIARLNREFVKALQAPEVKGRLENEGAELIGNTPEQAAAIIRADIAKWAEVIRKTGITAN
jgi:tripartite-type tricarboxylate transporter receptor subunit TctC